MWLLVTGLGRNYPIVDVNISILDNCQNEIKDEDEEEDYECNSESLSFCVLARDKTCQSESNMKVFL